MVDLEFGQIIISSMHANVNCTITKKEKNRHRKAGLKKLLIINNNLKNSLEVNNHQFTNAIFGVHKKTQRQRQFTVDYGRQFRDK
jgi:uncharacterized membrane protein YgaE (UPF0421/DUF939 family)